METIESLRKELAHAYGRLVWVALRHLSADDDEDVDYAVDTYGTGIRHSTPTQIVLHRRALVDDVQKVAYKRRIEQVDGSVCAPCPLCGERPVPSPRYKPGWELPRGLDTHLNGKGQTRQCVVMEALDKEIDAKLAELQKAVAP